jgi:hypothetical protein
MAGRRELEELLGAINEAMEGAVQAFLVASRT